MEIRPAIAVSRVNQLLDGEFLERDVVVSWCDAYNHFTNPARLKTDAESRADSIAARAIRERLRGRIWESDFTGKIHAR